MHIDMDILKQCVHFLKHKLTQFFFSVLVARRVPTALVVGLDPVQIGMGVGMMLVLPARDFAMHPVFGEVCCTITEVLAHRKCTPCLISLPRSLVQSSVS